MLVEAVNAHTFGTRVQMRHPEVLFKKVRTKHEKKDVLYSHTVHFGDVERGLTTITDMLKGVGNKTDVVSEFVSRLNEHVKDIGVIIGHKATEVPKGEEERQLEGINEQDGR